MSKYCFRFVDIVDDAASPVFQRDIQAGESMEFFYWTPDMPEIVIKQGHVVKNYLKHATATSPWMSTEPTGLGFTDCDNIRLYISTVGVNSLVYPGYVYDPINEFKPKALFWTPRDKWFHQLSESNTAYKNWKIALEGMWNDMPDYWKNDPSDPKKAFKGCISKPYFLE
jgi:hypothetical protein